MALELKPPSPEIDRGSNDRFINRQLSLLDFHWRVLARAQDPELPLLERARFLAIFSMGIDDFFQIRVAGLKEQLAAGAMSTAPDGMPGLEQLRVIRGRVLDLNERLSVAFRSVRGGLADAGVTLLEAGEVTDDERAFLADYFAEHVFHVLTPLAVDPAHPFPYISNLSLNLAVTVEDEQLGTEAFARVKVPPLLPRFVPLPGGERFVPLESVIAMHLDQLFPGLRIVGSHLFRITRDADLDLDDGDADDLLATVETELRRKRNKAAGVRLEVRPDMPRSVVERLLRELDLGADDVYPVTQLMDLSGLLELVDLDRPDLKPEPWVPTTPPELRTASGKAGNVFDAILLRDVLLHHPYDSFATSVEAFIEQAARDPHVLAIKQTLYRTSGPSSPIATALVDAAERGKQVVALVELKARGDERANITWAQRLEEAGVHVVYGMVGLKTHAKVTLVVRQDGFAIRNYVHIGTGNYNPSTAHSYEDIGLLSASPELGSDVAELFNLLTGYSRQRRYRRLLVAPAGLRSGLLQFIRREAEAGDGSITIKVNNLVDPAVIDALYEASCAGAQIDLIVRSMCALRPGVPAMSENIRVRSLVGRFLEHSRVFRFGSEARGFDRFIGSADLMERNLDRRVEALTPILSPQLQERIDRILEAVLADDSLAWELKSDGSWRKVPGDHLNAQVAFQEVALAHALPSEAASA